MQLGNFFVKNCLFSEPKPLPRPILSQSTFIFICSLLAAHRGLVLFRAKNYCLAHYTSRPARPAVCPSPYARPIKAQAGLLSPQSHAESSAYAFCERG
jgi:hypothetical protein